MVGRSETGRELGQAGVECRQKTVVPRTKATGPGNVLAFMAIGGKARVGAGAKPVMPYGARPSQSPGRAQFC